jgi:hypothetical protein
LQKKKPKNVGMEAVSDSTTQVTATNVQSLVQPTKKVGIEADYATKMLQLIYQLSIMLLNCIIY